MIKDLENDALELMKKLEEEADAKSEKGQTDNVHAGHRERLRERFAQTLTFDSFSQHEIIELMLFYILPRVNTNDLAHRLTEKYGDISGVLDAPLGELCSFKGLGRQSAIFLKMLMRLCCEYNVSMQKRVSIDDFDRVANFVRYHFTGEVEECAKLFCVSADGQVFSPFEIGRGGKTRTPVDLRRMMRVILGTEANCILIAHNHLNNVSDPSNEDVVLTRRIRQMIEPIGVKLLDHIIVSGNKVTSFRRIGLMDI